MTGGGKSAFTLAEVLITLGIIGIVAAMTLPVITAKYQAKVLHTRLLQANSIMQDGITRVRADAIDLNEVINGRDYPTLQKYFKSGNCRVPKNETEADYYNYYGELKAAGASASDLVYPYCLSNGMVLWFGLLNEPVSNEEGVWVSWKDSGNTILAIDINGWGTKPDQYGKDIFFWFYNMQDGQVKPLGNSNYFSKLGLGGYYTVCPGSRNDSEAGIGCSMKALAEPDYFYKLGLSH